VVVMKVKFRSAFAHSPTKEKLYQSQSAVKKGKKEEKYFHPLCEIDMKKEIRCNIMI
jgi:hypothetical protein